MLTSIEQVVQRIIEGYDPDRVILFGSHARGEALADSDVDLLIVKATDQRPLDRRIQVERLLADRRLALDILVYTPEEVRALYAAGSPFIEEVVETGRVLYMRKATAAEEGLLPHGEPTREDADRSVVAAERAMESVRKILGS